MEISRRNLFKALGVVGAVGISAKLATTTFSTKASTQIKKIATALPKPFKSLPAAPLDPALQTPGLSPLFTPTKDFFRIDTAFTVPEIDVSTWKLEIVGLVSKPISLTYDQLIARPTFELDDTIACVSNEVGGSLIGNARWQGIRLDDLINEAAPHANADQVMGYSVDCFTAGFPLAALDGRDAMIAIAMNGEALPPNHGYPARIIVPGLFGYVSAVKWLNKIELTRFDQKHGYWIEQGWSEQGPIKTQSRIDTPLNNGQTPIGKGAIAGVAWAPLVGISTVEVKIDNQPWRTATLGPEIAKTTWRQWWIDWNPAKGDHHITVRATDGNGQLQSSANVPIAPNGAEGWHTIKVQSL